MKNKAVYLISFILFGSVASAQNGRPAAKPTQKIVKNNENTATTDNVFFIYSPTLSNSKYVKFTTDVPYPESYLIASDKFDKSWEVVGTNGLTEDLKYNISASKNTVTVDLSGSFDDTGMTEGTSDELNNSKSDPYLLTNSPDPLGLLVKINLQVSNETTMDVHKGLNMVFTGGGRSGIMFLHLENTILYDNAPNEKNKTEKKSVSFVKEISFKLEPNHYGEAYGIEFNGIKYKYKMCLMDEIRGYLLKHPEIFEGTDKDEVSDYVPGDWIAVASNKAFTTFKSDIKGHIEITVDAPKKECPLQKYTRGKNFAGADIWADVDFFDSLDKIDKAAGEAGVKVVVTSSFRRVPIGGVDTSNHLIGHAIDMNPQYKTLDGKVVTVTWDDLLDKPMAAPVRDFIDRVKKSGVTYGENFYIDKKGRKGKVRDMVHFDDRWNVKNRNAWKEKFKIMQECAKEQGLPLG